LLKKARPVATRSKFKQSGVVPKRAAIKDRELSATGCSSEVQKAG
jgi:hypothetical protein